MISIEGVNLVFYIWILNTTIEVIMKNVQFQQYFIIILRQSTKKNYGFKIP